MKYCDQCGAALTDDALFCSACGTKSDSESVSPAKNAGSRRLNLRAFLMGAVASLLLLAAMYLLLPLSLGGGRGKLEGRGYSSAEAAALAYVDALQQGDLDAMLATFAQESFVKHLDRAALVSRIAINLDSSDVMVLAYLPDNSELALSLDAQGRRSLQARFIYMQYQDLLLGEKLFELKEPTSPYIPTRDEATRRELLNAMNAKIPFSSVMFERFVPVETVVASQSLDLYLTLCEDYRKIYGVEELQSLNLLLNIDGEEYLLFLTVGKYDGRWYNISIGNIASMCAGPISGLSSGLVSAAEFGL